MSQYLTEAELAAYEYWKKSDQPTLAITLNVKLFELFLIGKTTEEIRKDNPQYSMGQIVAARIEGEWDRRRDEHRDNLLKGTASRVQQSMLEQVGLFCDVFAAAGKEHGEKVRKYIQTGNPNDLGSLRIATIHDFKVAVEIFQKITGQDRPKKVEVTGEVTHRAVTAADPPPTPVEAASILKQLLGRKEN